MAALIKRLEEKLCYVLTNIGNVPVQAILGSYLLCQKVLNILKIGHGVIVDHVITSERIYKQLTEALKEYALIMVQVTCPLNELEKREKKRKDRYIGSAKASCEYLCPQKGYDLTLNTLELSPKECSKKICELLN